MGKFALFGLLWWVLGNPLLAVIILLVILYLFDRKFVGLFPSILRPFRTARRIAKLEQDLKINPHDTSLKRELAVLKMEKKKYRQALELLEEIRPIMSESADVHYEEGVCHLKLGDLEKGASLIEKALEMNPRVYYGEPYLRLAEAWLEKDASRALEYLEKFKEIHSSSCEAYYRLGSLYRRFGREAEAKDAFREAVDIYRTLPKYKKRSERRWMILSRLKSL